MKRVLYGVVAMAFLGCLKPGEGVDPKVIADGHYVAGQAAFLKGDFAEATKEFAEVKKLNPGDTRLPVAEGELALAQVKIDDAIASFEAAAKADPKRGATWSRLGYLYSLKRDKKKAHDALDKALAANPRDYSAIESLADLQLEEGDQKGAIENLRKALNFAPDIAKTELVLRLVVELPKAGRDAEVLPLLEEAVKQGTKSATVFNEMGDRYVTANRLPEAVSAYISAAQLDAKDPVYWELVGHLEARLGHPDEALTAFKKSLAVKDRGVVHVALARLCQAKKDDACVMAELDRAFASATGEEERETIDLAELLVSLGRKKDALSLLRSLSEEGEQKGNIQLHLRTAQLAKELNDNVTVTAACTRALASGQAGLKCP